MKTRFTLAAAWLGLLAWPLVGHAQPARPAIGLFFEQAVLSAAQLSPDGRLLALRIGSRGGRARLAVLDLQDMKPTIVADFKDADVDQFAWVNDRCLVFDLQQKMNGPGTAALGRGLFAIDADGSGYRQLVETTLSFVRAPDSGTPPLRWDTYLLNAMGTPGNDEVFVVVPEERSREKTDYIELQRLNTRSGRVTEVDAPLHTNGWTLDAQGALRLAVTRQRDRVAVHWRDPQGQWRQLGITDLVRYKAADGLEIPAYLTLPPGHAKKNLPPVVLVHGGPWVRGNTWAWHPEVQFLASRGDAVLQPEFRGSTGFGRAHFEAGWKQWGQAMQTDLADGARWAIAPGIADPKRVSIAGASYGGYATLMGLAREPALFRCGVSWVGVTDLPILFSVSWSDTTTEVKQYGMPRLLGDPVAHAAMLKAQSPLTQAARIRPPLLMAYGAWDMRVPLIHGEAFRDAVKPHNPQLEWVVYPEEGHGWDKPETRIDFWGRVERFLGRHLAAE